MRLLFLPGSRTSPAARFRTWQFVEPLRMLGHAVEVRVIRPDRHWTPPSSVGVLRKPIARVATACRLASAAWTARDAGRFDAIVMNRDLIPEVRIGALEPLLARMNPRIVFDLDDAIYLGRRDGKLRRILPHFGAVVAGNEELAAYLRRHNPNVRVIPTVADGDRFRPAPWRNPGPVRISWTGSAEPLRLHLPLVREAMEDLARDREFEFVVISDERPEFNWRGVRTRFVKWRAETEVEDLRQFDIGLMPLPDGPFERAKCAAKAVLYMAVGIPAVVSPVGASGQVVIDGETGFHCLSREEWRMRLEALVDDIDLRRRLGAAGRKRFEKFYSLRAVLPRWVELLQAMVARRTGRLSQRGRAVPAMSVK